MSSTTAVLPVGPMREWCLSSFDSSPDSFRDMCAITTHGHEADFTTICCDGVIINTSANIWSYEDVDYTTFELTDMVCCRQAGRNPGGLMPLPADYTHCASGEPTPLASMAATNTGNAQNFAVTYISASAGTADWTTRSTPSCLWVNTRNVSATTEVVLPAAVVTTLPSESDEAYYTGSGVDATSEPVLTTPGSNGTAGFTQQTEGDSATSAPDRTSTTTTPSAPASSSAPGENTALRLGTTRWSIAFLIAGLLAAACLTPDAIV